MLSKTFFLIISILLFSHDAYAKWRVFFYIDSSDGLSDMAIKNITDMMTGNPNESVDYRIQLHAYGQVGLRYKISHNALFFVEKITLTGNSQGDAINAANWAFNCVNPDDHTLFIISDHGWGILDPEWDEFEQEWKVQTDQNALLNRSCSYNVKEAHQKHKGVLFNKQERTYLNNNDLITVLNHVSTNILHKKIDILAFDTCMGDMLEIAYQIEPYVSYLVGSQSCSLVDGFDYQNILPLCNQDLEPEILAKAMVQVFDNYFSCNDESGIYTHAALDLSKVYSVTHALDTMITLLLKYPDFASAIVHACKNSPRFCMWPMYTDLVAFCKLIEEEIFLKNASSDLNYAIHNLYSKIQDLVIAHCGGITTKSLAHGVAIYLPFKIIDDAYCNTLFAQETQWLKLLKHSSDYLKKCNA